MLFFNCFVLLAGSGAVHFVNGMCKLCFDDFVKATGGISEGADPPAYNADTASEVFSHYLMHPSAYHCLIVTLSALILLC